MKKLNSQSGFTIIELLLALAFFSFILLFATAGFIQINRSYSKGLTVKQIHETGRNVIEDIARSIRLSDDIRFDPSPNQRRLETAIACYGWNELLDSGTDREEMAGGGPGTFILNFGRSEQDSCLGTPIERESESFLDRGGEHPREDPNTVYGGIVVVNLDISRVGQAVKIDLTLASSDPEGDLINVSDPNNVQCRGSIVVGDQFCDTVRLTTTVTLRT